MRKISPDPSARNGLPGDAFWKAWHRNRGYDIAAHYVATQFAPWDWSPLENPGAISSPSRFAAQT